MDVDDAKIAELVARMDTTGSVLVPWRRRRAARRLASVRSPAAARALVTAYVSHNDDQVVAIAEAALAGLDDQASIDAVCDSMIAYGNERLTALVGMAGHLHSDPTRRALQLFLDGKFERYAELDFDGTMLATAHALADSALRARLAERARGSARVDWVRAIAAHRNVDRLRELSDREWEAATGILVAGGRWDDLWQMACDAPPVWGVRMLVALAGQAWRPERGAERDAFDRLAHLARTCLAELPGGPVTAESAVLRGHTARLSCLAVTADGTLLASAGYDGAVRLWQLPSGAPAGQLRSHARWVQSLAVTPDGTLLASGGDHVDGKVRLVRLPFGASTGVLAGHRGGVACLAVTPDGTLLASGAHGEHEQTVRLWRLPSGEPAGVLTGHRHWVKCLAVTPDSKLLVSGGGGGLYVDGEVRLWHLPSGEPAGVLSGHKYGVACLAVTPDGALLASGGGGYDRPELRLWHLPSGEPAGVLSGHTSAVTSFAMTPDGALLASSGLERTVRLWHLPSGEPAGVLTGHGHWVDCLAVTPDGTLLASGDEGGVVRLWHLPSGEPAGVLTGHERVVRCLAVTPDGMRFASGSDDQTVRLWHLALRVASRTPVGEIDVATVERLRDTMSDDGELAWASMMAELVRWRRRYDVEVGDATRGAGSTDVEIGE